MSDIGWYYSKIGHGCDCQIANRDRPSQFCGATFFILKKLLKYILFNFSDNLKKLSTGRNSWKWSRSWWRSRRTWSWRRTRRASWGGRWRRNWRTSWRTSGNFLLMMIHHWWSQKNKFYKEWGAWRTTWRNRRK